jgi:hypothetical protein
MKRTILVKDFVSAYRAYIELIFKRPFQIDPLSTEEGITHYNLLQYGKFPVH